MPDYRHVGNKAVASVKAGSDEDKKYAADPEWQLCPEPGVEPVPAPAPVPKRSAPVGTIEVTPPERPTRRQFRK